MSMILLLCLLYVSPYLSKVKLLLKNSTQRPALRQGGYGGKVCGRMCGGIYHGYHFWWFWNSPLNLILKTFKMYAPVLAMPEFYSSLIILCWGLACTYRRALFNSIQHLQDEENASGADPAPVTDAAAKSENQLMLVSANPTVKKKHWM